MPNKEGGYGGYRQSPQRGARKVRAPGAEGGVRRGVTPPGLTFSIGRCIIKTEGRSRQTVRPPNFD